MKLFKQYINESQDAEYNQLRLEFENEMRGTKLYYGTRGSLKAKIQKEGLTNKYNYFCHHEGWKPNKDDIDIVILADSVMKNLYPDPEYVLSIHFKEIENNIQELKNCFIYAKEDPDHESIIAGGMFVVNRPILPHEIIEIK